MTAQKEKLFSEFPPITTEEWMAKITTDLKGAPFEKKLVWRTGEGFNVNPFYRAEDIEGMPTTTSLPGEFPYVRGTKITNEWGVRQEVTVTDCKIANEKVKTLLTRNGITSIGFTLKSEQVNEQDLATLLEGISPEEVDLNFTTSNHQAAKLLSLLIDNYQKRGANLSRCKGTVQFDPLKKPLLKGREASNPIQETVDVLKASEPLPLYRVLSINAVHINSAGAYIFQELGYALAWGNDLIAQLTEHGLSVEEVASKIQFNFGVTSNYFMEIAKFRAARWLWAEIVKAYNPSSDDACKMVMHATTSNWNMTLYDAHVNMLRTQTEAMSAAIGSVDSMTVTPFDDVYNTPDEFSERIARNQQLLLKEECHFDKVVDPAGGSYYVEVLTSSLAEVAWKLFLEVEAVGGFTKEANAGHVQNAVNDSNKARKKAIATRRMILLGTNQYPNFTEEAGEKRQKETASSSGCSSAAPTIPSLDLSRGASDFESLRLSTEMHDKTPKAFMLTIGSLAMRLARSQFSCNFFACAGYQVIDNLGFETIDAGVAEARKQGADIIVLCSSDDEYVTLAPEAYALVKDKELFVVAGAPACTEDLKAQGIEHFINVKSNVLETLQLFNNQLGIMKEVKA